MLPLLLSALAGATPTIEDEADARYLAGSDRPGRAAAWYAAQMEAEPDDWRWPALYMRVLSGLPELRSPVLVELAEAWRDAHPEDELGGVVVARALAASSLGRNTHMFGSGRYLAERGPWCAAAVEALDATPADPEARFIVLAERSGVADVCKEATEALDAERDALAASGEAGPWPRAWVGAKDGIDADDLEAIDAALAIDKSWNLPTLGGVFAEDVGGDAELVKEAQARVVAHATELAASDRPSRVWVAARILERAEEREAALAAYRRVAELDRGNYQAGWAISRLSRTAPPEPRDTLRATTLLDPHERLEALRSAPRGDNSWDRTEYWSARAEAARGVGDADEELHALDKLWRVSSSDEPNLRFARACVAAGRRLKTAHRAAKIATSWRRDRWSVGLDAAEAERWRERLAEALDVEALVLEARGRTIEARDLLEEALSLAPPTADRRLRLGLLYTAEGSDTAAVALLAAALVELQDAEVRTALARSLDASSILAPGGVDGFVEAMATHLARAEATAEEPPEEPLDGSRFEDLVVDMDGEQTRLLDLEGPLVVDLWATWCGPCVESLPHLDALAREHGDAVTFVALSVDEEPQTAERYLSRRGGGAFETAWGGKEAMEHLGVSGIPAMFVFDADHQLVARLSGWGPGSTSLDDAVDAMLGR